MTARRKAHLLPLVPAPEGLPRQLPPHPVDLLVHLGHLRLPPLPLGDAELEEVLLQLFLKRRKKQGVIADLQAIRRAVGV